MSRSFFCPCCEKRVSHWEDWDASYRNVICPRCGSHPRHRLITLWFEHIASSLKNASVLHFAPEKPIRRRIVDVAKEYITADLRKGRSYEHDRHEFLYDHIDVQTDVTDMQFPWDRFDVVVCSHVLEHVPNDMKALQEIFRVLKYGGWALLQTPFNRCRAVTLERTDIDTPELRHRYYWQEDHLRQYGRDIFARFFEAGFLPAIIPPGSLCNDPSFYGLQPDEDLMIVRKVWTYPHSYLDEEIGDIQSARAGLIVRGKAA